MITRLLRRRPSAWLLAAALLAVVAAVGTMRAAARGQQIQTVVAARDLPVGAQVSDPTHVRLQAVPAQTRLEGLHADVASLAGRVAAVPIAAGEPITDAAVGGRPDAPPQPLAPGERAISVPASAAGAALPVLVPGAHVDVLGTVGESGDAQVVVRAAEVITVQGPAEQQVGTDAGAVLLRVSEAEALRLSAALDRGAGVRLIPRSARDGDAP